jgi:pyrroline-5-carboxylate reductase
MRTIIVVGVGGVGSHLAHFFSRFEKDIKKIILVDADKVEEKNLSRQFYFKEDIGKYKVDALAERIRSIRKDLLVIPMRIMIESGTELNHLIVESRYDMNNYIFVCTDGIESKQTLLNRFNSSEGSRCYAIGCDEDMIVIATKASAFENVWNLGEGYNTQQTGLENSMAAVLVYSLYKSGGIKYIEGDKIKYRREGMEWKIEKNQPEQNQDQN